MSAFLGGRTIPVEIALIHAGRSEEEDVNWVLATYASGR